MNVNESLPLRFAVYATFIAVFVGNIAAFGQSNVEQLTDPKWTELVTSTIPGDMSPEMLVLRGETRSVPPARVALLNRAFNIYSWRSFLAINWPLAEGGKPAASPTPAGGVQLRWMGWKEVFDVYRENGATPRAWGDKRRGPTVPGLPPLPPFKPLDRILYHTNKMEQVADEENQAFAGPLWDQSGNIVRYEVLMNREEFEYIFDNELYNLEGQIAFTKNHDKADFPSGVFNGDNPGAIEIKVAWKILVEGVDDPSRYYHIDGVVLNPDKTAWEARRLGMIGFHISQKTKYAPQWVWSTFEQVDNVRTNPLDLFHGEPIRPSLNNPQDEIAPINVQPLADAPIKKTQVQRGIPIPKDLEALNHNIQAWFKEQGSVWQYYELIGTQYPLQPTAHPGAVVQQKPLQPAKTKPVQRPITPELRIAVDNKPGGVPNLTYLTNMTMETYFQNGNQFAVNFMEGSYTPASDTMVFGTESCMGCHSSAGIATDYTVTAEGLKTPYFSGQLTGDFSWLLSQKAHWKNPKADEDGDSE